MADGKKNRFLRGMVLAWIPSALILLSGFRGMTAALGSTLGFTNFYLIPVFPCEVAAIFLLLTSFSRHHPIRAAIAVTTILWSALLIALFALAVSTAITAAF